MSEKVKTVFPILPGGEREFDPPITVEVTFSDSPTIIASEVVKIVKTNDGGWWLMQSDQGAAEIRPGYTHIEFNPPDRG